MNRKLRNQEIENNQRNKEISKIFRTKSRVSSRISLSPYSFEILIIQRLNEKRQNEFERTRNIFKRRNSKSKKRKILEDERLSKGYMVNWPIRREKSRRSNIKNIIYFLTCKFTIEWINLTFYQYFSRMFKEPEKLIKSPMDMGKFQRSEGYRKGLLLYHSKMQIRAY